MFRGQTMLSKSRIVYILCFLIILLLGFFFFPHLYPLKRLLPTSTQAFKKISEVKHASDADYLFLQESIGQEEWIYKQIIVPSPEDQIVLVLEIFASEIAQTVGIPINHVRIISGDDYFEHRLFDKLPGSLHLKVPGKCVEDYPPWEGFDIHQKIRSPFIIARIGALASEEIGLRREVIQNMAKHPDLAKIAALDTYLGNNDRSNINIFYDEKVDAFYGIDMGNCFMGNLAQCAQEKLQDFFAHNSLFSKEELLGLNRYRQALCSLISQFPPAKSIELLEDTLKKAGFVPDNLLLWDEGTERKLSKWKLAIEENYKSTVQLINLLEQINKYGIIND
jgi:hypothetical protein